MAFHVIIMISVLMTLLTNKYTNTIIPTYISCNEYSQILVDFASQHFYDEILSWMTETWMESQLGSSRNRNIVNL